MPAEIPPWQLVSDGRIIGARLRVLRVFELIARTEICGRRAARETPMPTRAGYRFKRLAQPSVRPICGSRVNAKFRSCAFIQYADQRFVPPFVSPTFRPRADAKLPTINCLNLNPHSFSIHRAISPRPPISCLSEDLTDLRDLAVDRRNVRNRAQLSSNIPRVFHLPTIDAGTFIGDQMNSIGISPSPSRLRPLAGHLCNVSVELPRNPQIHPC